MSTERIPARGEVWECADGRHLLVIQHDRLNAELATIIGLVVSDVSQRAPEPVRIGLSPEATGLEHPLWVKVSLIVTVPRSSLERPLTAVSAPEMAWIESAVVRVLDLPNAQFS